MFRRLAASALLWAACCLTAAAQEAAPGAADREAIVAVIARQIEAFRRDDGAAAFAVASPEIQRRFGTAEAFMAMVRQHYRPVYRPREVHFEELLLRQGRLLQRVRLLGPSQRLTVAFYVMQRHPDGTWRIAGCFLFAAPERAA